MTESLTKQESRTRNVSGLLSAWFYAIFVLLVSTVLLVCNSLFCYVLVSFIPMPDNRVATAVISQLIYYLLPIALTFFQWYLFDQLKRSFA